MPSPALPTPRPAVSRELLERIRRDVLARVLAPQRDFFAGCDLSLDALAATVQDDLTLVNAAFSCLVERADAPIDLLTSLAAIEGVASDAGHERLRMVDRDRKLPAERLGHETLAAIAFLDHLPLFAEVKTVAKGPAVAALFEYPGRSKRPLSRDPSRLAALGRSMGTLFGSRGRPPHCAPRLTADERRTTIEFVFGRLPATTERLTETFERTQAVDVFTQRARALVDHKTGHLLVSGYEFMRDGIRRLVGQHLLDDPDFFQVLDVYSLAPLQEALEATLTPEPSLGVEAIELLEIHLRHPDGVRMTYAHDASLLASSVGLQLREALSAGARVSFAKLAVKLAGRKRAVLLRILPPNKLEVARSDEALVDDMRELIARKGFLRVTVTESGVVRRDVDASVGEVDGEIAR